MKTGLYSNTVILELDNIKNLTQNLGNPQNSLKFIHVSGTNGKGSICAFLQSSLNVAGYTVGKFTSPEIKTVCDSITVDGENIKKDELDILCSRVQEAGEASDFEVLTVAAFLYFKEKNCDFVILETGLGGTGDATNIISAPLYSVIGRISLDHTNFLGNTIEEIAKRKAGIIKRGGKTVTLATQKESVLNIIADKCEKENNLLILTKEAKMLSPIGIYEHFLYSGLDIVCGLSGLHQIENAALAIEVLSDLKIHGSAIIEGIKNAKNPARFEVLSENPPIIFDGAHNPDGVESLLKSLERYYPDTEKTFIIGMMRDKDIENTVTLFKKYGEDKRSAIIAVEVKENPRSEKSKNIKKAFEKNGFLASCESSLKSALKKVKKENRLTVVCGSLYLYRELYM